MRDEQHQFLALVGQAPARLTVEQTAWLLGCQAHDVPVLISAKLVKPLGTPPPNGIKYFSTAEILEAVKDRSWLAKMTNTVTQHWQKKNGRKTAFVGIAREADTPSAQTLAFAAGGR